MLQQGVAAVKSNLNCAFETAFQSAEKEINIADRGEGEVKNISTLQQVRKTLAQKAALEHKSKAAVSVEYVKNVLGGKRRLDTKDTAAERKALYSEFHLFDT